MRYIALTLLVAAISSKSFSQTKIDVSELSAHIGDSVVVFGKVSDTTYSSTYGATVFHIAQPGGGTFDVLIKSENRGNFKFPSLNLANNYVRIIGKITSAAGRNQIYVTAGQQLAVVLGE